MISFDLLICSKRVLGRCCPYSGLSYKSHAFFHPFWHLLKRASLFSTYHYILNQVLQNTYLHWLRFNTCSFMVVMFMQVPHIYTANKNSKQINEIHRGDHFTLTKQNQNNKSQTNKQTNKSLLHHTSVQYLSHANKTLTTYHTLPPSLSLSGWQGPLPIKEFPTQPPLKAKSSPIPNELKSLMYLHTQWANGRTNTSKKAGQKSQRPSPQLEVENG